MRISLLANRKNPESNDTKFYSKGTNVGNVRGSLVKTEADSLSSASRMKKDVK